MGSEAKRFTSNPSATLNDSRSISGSGLLGRSAARTPCDAQSTNTMVIKRNFGSKLAFMRLVFGKDHGRDARATLELRELLERVRVRRRDAELGDLGFLRF